MRRDGSRFELVAATLDPRNLSRLPEEHLAAPEANENWASEDRDSALSENRENAVRDERPFTVTNQPPETVGDLSEPPADQRAVLKFVDALAAARHNGRR